MYIIYLFASDWSEKTILDNIHDVIIFFFSEKTFNTYKVGTYQYRIL